MKASKLINKLAKLVEAHGDLDVRFTPYNPYMTNVEADVVMVKPYDKDGNGPPDDAVGPLTKFYIH